MSNGPTDKAKALIDESLRRVFEEHLDQDLPERFLLLINKLRADEAEGEEANE